MITLCTVTGVYQFKVCIQEYTNTHTHTPKGEKQLITIVLYTFEWEINCVYKRNMIYTNM